MTRQAQPDPDPRLEEGGQGVPRESQAAVEALRLFEAIQDWARASSFGDMRAHLSAAADSGFATDSADCRLCPICQVVGALRTHHPEVAEHLSDAVSSLTAAARSAMRERDEETRTARRDPVEHIDIV